MTLHILHLEDNPTDAELAQVTLEADGIECELTRVETRADFLAAVEQGGFDLILADYSLPSFDGLAALDIAREKRPDVPFLFLTGTLGEEVAIESLKSGARDYVLKERMSRLASSVRRALREAEERTARQRAEEAQRASEKRFRALIENSSDGIVLLSAEATVLYDSPSIRRILGYAHDERIGRNVFEFIHPDERQTGLERFAEFVQQRGATANSQGRFRHKDGSWRWIEAVRNNLLDEPSVQAIVVNYRDTTQRVRAEQRLAAQYAVVRCLAASDTLADAVPQILQAICESLEWDQGEAWSVLWNADLQANVLRCVGTWHPPSASFPEFEAVARQIEFAPGVGLPGRVWASGEPAWIPDVTQDANFPRAPVAAKEGLRAGFAFPLKSDGGVLGVMGFFSREIRQPDNDLLQMLTGISSQISQFIERKRAEEGLRNAEARYRAIFEQSPNGVLLIDLETGTTIEANETAHNQLGYTREEFATLRISDYEVLEKPEETAEHMQKIIREGSDDFETLQRTKSGEIRNMHVWAKTVQLGDRGLFYGIVQDITERKQAEEETRLLLALTQTINAAPDFDSALRMALQKVCESTEWAMGEAWIPNAAGSALELSPIWYGNRPGLEEFLTGSQHFNFPPGKGLPGRVWASRQSEWLKDASVDGEIFPRAAIAVQAGIKAALAVPTFTGDQVLVLVFFMSETREEDRRLVEIVAAAAAQLGSQLQRKRAEERLRQSEERYRTLAEAAHDAIFIISRDDRVEYVNSFAAGRFHARPEDLIGQPRTALFPPDVAEPQKAALLHVFESGEPVYAENQTRFPDGEVWLGTRLAPIRDEAGEVWAVLGIARDITERKRAEAGLAAKNEELRAMTQQMWQTAKLATMGELAASIAHELNNPLGTVSLRVESLSAQVPPGDPMHRELKVIEQEVDRMGTLVANLLQFSRRGSQQISTLDVREEIDRTLELIHYHLRQRQVAVVRDFAPDLPLIQADRQHLRQLFLNLFTNAADAMPEGGTLTLRVSAVENQVLIEITDTGMGIAPENLPKVMEPFFTTKPDGKGTGLGLAICRRVAQEHGGTLAIASAGPGQGATVRVTLPIQNETNGQALTAT